MMCELRISIDAIGKKLLVEEHYISLEESIKNFFELKEMWNV